jgi:nitroreductase
MERELSLMDIVLSRRSIRSYQKKELPTDVLHQILEAGRQAPSAVNRQPLHLIAVTDENIKREFSKGLFNRFIKDAPLTIVGCANTSAVLTGKWAVVDTAIALQNMVIAAWAMGVGSCWIGDFKEERVKQTLQIPNKWTVVALISFGYPSEQPKPRTKKPITQLVSFNKFGRQVTQD